jgi:predicted lipid carrier protein YhbT
MTANDTTEEFFSALAERGHEPLLQKVKGTVRVELRSGKKLDRWLVSMNRGDIVVSRRNAAADSVIRTESAVFEGMVRGEVSAIAALLRGALRVEGDTGLLLQFQRLLAPSTQREQPHAAGYARRHQ